MAKRIAKKSEEVQTVQAEEVNNHSEEKSLAINTPDMLVLKAIESGAGIETLERLVALQERWEARQAKAAFLEALAGFQKEVPTIIKEKGVDYESKRTGSKVDYKYATLGYIDQKIKDVMFKHGLTKEWKISDKDGKIVVTCVISHKQGHSESTTMEASADDSGNKNAIQSRGSTVTYLQRYTLIGALGLTTAETDNDGRGSGKVPVNEPPGGDSRPGIGQVRFSAICKLVGEGKMSMEEVEKMHYLTDDQRKGLEIIAKKGVKH